MLNLTQTLDAVRRRWLLLRALRVSAHALVGTALVAAAAGLPERWFQPSDGAALALAAVTGLLVIAAAAIVPWTLRTRPDDRESARFREARCPELGDAVGDAVHI